MDDPRTYEAGPCGGWDGHIWIHELSCGKKLCYRRGDRIGDVLVFRIVPAWNHQQARDLYVAGDIDIEEFETVLGWCLAAEKAELAAGVVAA